MMSLNCPKCNATLDIEDGLDIFFCKYCGNKVILSGMSSSAYKAKSNKLRFEHEKNQQELKYKNERERWEREEITKEREYKRLEKTKRRENRMDAFPFVINLFILIGIFGILGYMHLEHKSKISSFDSIVSEIESNLENQDYDNAILLANRLYLNDDYSTEDTMEWDNKRNYYIKKIRKLQKDSGKYNFLTVPYDSEKCTKLSKISVGKDFKKAGFNYIEYMEVEGKSGLFKPKNAVEHITIDGESTFTKNDSFIDSAQIIIYYFAE